MVEPTEVITLLLLPVIAFAAGALLFSTIESIRKTTGLPLDEIRDGQ